MDDQLPEESGNNRDYQVGYRKPPVETRFGPGNNANPGGRPKNLSLTAILHEVLARDAGKGDGRTIADALIAVAVKKAAQGDFRFFREIINRVDGKLVEKIELSGNSDAPLVVIRVGGKASVDDL